MLDKEENLVPIDLSRENVLSTFVSITSYEQNRLFANSAN